jgi:hypothetical protein
VSVSKAQRAQTRTTPRGSACPGRYAPEANSLDRFIADAIGGAITMSPLHPDDATRTERLAKAEASNRKEVKDCPDLLQLGRSTLPTSPLQLRVELKSAKPEGTQIVADSSSHHTRATACKPTCGVW